jgi:hypothetical protein
VRVLLLSAVLLALAGCTDEREQPCRLAVRSLAAAPEDRAAGELKKVLAFGRYALPDIEQELHAASTTGRKRLIEALRKLREREAIPFLEIVARWDEEPEVRALAREVAASLRNATR